MVRSRIATLPRRSSTACRRARATANIFHEIFLAAEHVEASSRGVLPPRVPRSLALPASRYDGAITPDCAILSARDPFVVPYSRQARVRIVDHGTGRDVTVGNARTREISPSRHPRERKYASQRVMVRLVWLPTRNVLGKGGRGQRCSSRFFVDSIRTRRSRNRESARRKMRRLLSIPEKSTRDIPNRRNMFRCCALNVVLACPLTRGKVSRSNSKLFPRDSLWRCRF